MGGVLPAQTYQEIEKNKANFESLRGRLKLKHFKETGNFSKKFPKAYKFFQEKGLAIGKIREHSAKLIGAGALTGSLLLSPPIGIKALPTPTEIFEKLGLEKAKGNKADKHELLVTAVKSVLPQRPRPLEGVEEKYLEQIFKNILGISAKAVLEGEHLNTTCGYIGIEQHLRRFPGDILIWHGKGDILQAGIAPGRGAWGYFASSKEKMTPDLEEIEKWYAVVQTLYLPNWNTRSKYLKEWYKYRKVLIVNVDNGKAVVAAIADSGPAAWTGKSFGGSPEVMDYLGGIRYKKGPVVVFFVDDPENKVALGPVNYD